MGITIDVESIITHSKNRYGPGERREIQEEYVRVICHSFGWENVPWEEPSETRGDVSTSASYGRYALALGMAEGSFPRLEPPEMQKFYNAPYAWLSGMQRKARYCHFLDHDEYNTFYLPVDFTPPRRLENSHLASPGHFVVGSSIQLAREISEIEEIALYYCDLFGKESRAEPESNPLSSSYTWDGVLDVCVIFRQACQESIELNLPVQLLY
ncbi:MAG TPA: hypothetical protein VH186_25265 [Chloroflexia bacterium]|nr:hypothetical protein [Chloroflexia bacterium]